MRGGDPNISCLHMVVRAILMCRSSALRSEDADCVGAGVGVCVGDEDGCGVGACVTGDDVGEYRDLHNYSIANVAAKLRFMILMGINLHGSCSGPIKSGHTNTSPDSIDVDQAQTKSIRGTFRGEIVVWKFKRSHIS